MRCYMGDANTMNIDEDSNHPAQQKKSANKTISKKTVAISFLGSLLIALLITWGFAGFDSDVLMRAHRFPLGLSICIIAGRATLYLSYAIYIAIFLCACIRREKDWFITLLVVWTITLCWNILCWLLLFNIAETYDS